MERRLPVGGDQKNRLTLPQAHRPPPPKPPRLLDRLREAIRVRQYSICTEMGGVLRLVSSLLYGTGMRLLEGLRVRVKDIDFMARIVVMREGKGDKDRRTMLPRPLIEPLQQHLDVVRRIHENDRHAGFGEV